MRLSGKDLKYKYTFYRKFSTTMTIRLKIFVTSVVMTCFLSVTGYSQRLSSVPRVFVFTDISNEPDDEESLVRFLVYSNEYDIEGLVACTSCWLKEGVREDLIRRQLDAYNTVRSNLMKHANGFPTMEYLRSVTCSGQNAYGLEATGKGKSTDGSRLFIEAAMKDDPRPLWVLLWGGANTFAQALYDLKEELTAQELKSLISKLKVYSISDQDDAGYWIRKEFPELFFIVDPSNPDLHNYCTATWNGIAGDRHNGTGVGYHFELVDNPWLEQNIINGHGALGERYPRLAFQMEGDTPSFLGLIGNGLGWTESPDYGGWGGRYKLYQAYGETRPIWTTNKYSRDTFEYECGKTHTSNDVTIWRWRDHFQYDFAARMDWCVADDFKDANHNPVAIVNGDTTKDVIHLHADGKTAILLSAKGSYDPDGNDIIVKWWIYPEAGTVKNAVLSAETGDVTTVDLSQVDVREGTLHVILQINDNGSPNLYAYRRVIIHI